MAFKKPVFKLVVANLTDKLKDDPETLSKLTDKKCEIDMLAEKSTELIRKARVAAAEAQIAVAQQEMATQQFLVEAGKVDERIARESSAMPPYTNSKGEICVDIPFTQREQRLLVRAQHNQLKRAAEGEDDIDPDLFEGNEGDEGDNHGPNGKLGFC
jgi:hypothetical protein